MDCKLCVGGGARSITREVVIEPWGQNFAVPAEQVAEFVARDAAPGFYWHVVASAPDLISVFAEGASGEVVVRVGGQQVWSR